MRVLVILLISTCLFSLLPVADSGRSEESGGPPLYDHHVHLLSPDLIRDWKSQGVPFTRPDEFYSAIPPDVADGRVKKAFALSMAYLYGSEWFSALKLTTEQELEAVRRENDFIAGVVKKNSDRLVGFCSANPVKEYALEELQRCTKKPGMKGVKLHLLNSGFDVEDKTHLVMLRALLAWAEKERVPMMIHLNAYDPAGPAEMAEAFAKELAAVPKLEVYIAHLGGSGGYSDRGRRILSAFIDALKTDKTLSAMDLKFEISAVVLTEPSDEVEPPTEEQLTLLAGDLRELGLERVVFGTDHPSFAAESYQRTLHEKLPLEKQNIAKILSNKGKSME